MLAPSFRFLLLASVGLFLLSATAGASPIAPVQIVNSSAGHIATAHADRHGDTVYIGGLVNRLSSLDAGAHVHVWGLNKQNHLVFSQTDPVSFTGNPSLVHTASYLVTVSPQAIEKATTIFVTYHPSHLGAKEQALN